METDINKSLDKLSFCALLRSRGVISENEFNALRDRIKNNIRKEIWSDTNAKEKV